MRSNKVASAKTKAWSHVCGNQLIMLTLTGTTNSKNIEIFIRPDMLVQGLFAIINRYQKNFVVAKQRVPSALAAPEIETGI